MKKAQLGEQGRMTTGTSAKSKAVGVRPWNNDYGMATKEAKPGEQGRSRDDYRGRSASRTRALEHTIPGAPKAGS